MDSSIPQTRPHVYLIGGWGSTPDVWQPVAEHLRQASLAFSTVDWQELLQDPQTLDRLLLERQASEEMGPTVLVGWSLGGMLALQAALKNPSTIAGLVMVGSTARMSKTDSYPGVDPLVIKGFKLQLRFRRQKTLRDFSNLCFTDVATGQVMDPQASEAYFQQCMSCEHKMLTHGLNYLIKTDLRDSLDTLADRNECKIKILHTRDDAVMPCAEAEYLARRFPHSELIMLESGTHALPITASEKVAEVILSLFEPESEVIDG